MLEHLLDFICCPKDKSKFSLKVFSKSTNNEVIDGVLTCNKCLVNYFIVDGVPRLLSTDLYWNDLFFIKYEKELTDLRINETQVNVISQNTGKSFGFEWNRYSDFGWNDPEFNMEYTRKRFNGTTLLEPNELSGKIVLDAGCGNGRYSYVAKEYGAKEIFAIDLSESVDIAYNHLREFENIHVIQTDIFNLPFPQNMFEIIFSIGVLHHTGNTEKAFSNLMSHLKNNGLISINLYHKQNPVNEFNDKLIRSMTTKMDLKSLYKMSCNISKIATAFDKVRLYKNITLLKLINIFIRLEKHDHQIFDWYSAPHADRYSYKEILKMFYNLNITPKSIRGGISEKKILMKIFKIVIPDWAIAVKGIKREK